MTEQRASQSTDPSVKIAPWGAADDAVQFRLSTDLLFIPMVGAVVCCIGLFAALFFQLRSHEPIEDPVIKVILFVLGLAGAVFVWAYNYDLYRFRNSPMVVSRTGLHVPWSAADPISWDDIRTLRTTVQTHPRTHDNWTLHIELKDPDTHEPSTSGPWQRPRDSSLGKPGPTITAGLSQLKVKEADVVEAIKKRAPKALLDRSDFSA